MSTTETVERTALLCPKCGGKIEVAQTICDICRSEIEEQTMAVRAADFPRLFEVVEQSVPEKHHPLDPASMDMLKIAEQTADDLDLVPLVPIDEPRKIGSDNGAAAAPSSGTDGTGVSSAVVIAKQMADYSASTMAVNRANRPSEPRHNGARAPKLEPSSRWKHVIIAVIFVAVAAVLAMLLWAVLVPRGGATGNNGSGFREADASAVHT